MSHHLRGQKILSWDNVQGAHRSAIFGFSGTFMVKFTICFFTKITDHVTSCPFMSGTKPA